MKFIKPSTPRFWILLAMSLFPLAMIIVYWVDYTSSRERELANGSEQVRNFSHMYAEQVSRSLAGVDLLVEELGKIFNEHKSWKNWPEAQGHAILRGYKPRYLPQLRDTAIYDETGLQRFHSTLLPAPNISIRDRRYFLDLSQGAERALFGPFKGRNSGIMTYALSRRINNEDGSFGGVVLAAMELAQFQSTCWNGQPDAALQGFLINKEGIIIAECKPPTEVLRGTSAIGQKLSSKFPQLSMRELNLDGTTRNDKYLITAHRVLGYEELSVVAILSRENAMSDWRSDQRRSQFTLAMALLTMFGSFYWIWVQMQRQKKNESKINELAFFDALTRLPNRTLLMDRLRQSMAAGARHGVYGAVLFIDLDHFKVLNDTLGHDKGDMLLQEMAQRLRQCVRKSDTVARLGGDEFVVVLQELHANRSDAAAQTELISEKIRSTLNQTIQLGQLEYRSSASIGATLFVGNQTPIDDLLRQADLAMYQAKEGGRNALRFFDPSMQTLVMERARLAEELRLAIAEQQFVLHYQPQVDHEGRIVGAEALVRWQHPVRGMVPPASFIPMTEETGMILPLGTWVLETACQQLRAWQADPLLAPLSIAVNVSVQQFRKADFVDTVLAVIERTGANPVRLKLELTESLLVDNVEGIVKKMHDLKTHGICFSLDDFGTGYSSLSYLKRLPLDQLKIDQSFVRDVLIDPNDAAIAKTVVALAHSLELGVIAEGVETAAQRDFLANAGCHSYQGYFFSRPVPVERFEQIVQNGVPLA